MLKFSRKTDYAVQALLHMAAEEPAGPVSAREIAECHDIPVELTAKLLQALVRAGLCASRQGARGGYRLDRPAEQVTLAAIIAAVDGAPAADPEGDGSCAPLAAIRTELRARFDAITLADLARRDRHHAPARIYLDHQATTPLDPRVREAMAPYLDEKYGNASSDQHLFGWEAAAAAKVAREQVAALIGAEPREIVFTSGATEADNLALRGVAEAYASRGRHLVTCATEHAAVLDVCADLERRGWEITVLPVDAEGRLDPADLAAALREDTVLVSLMAANNEIGLLHPLDELAPLVHRVGALLHVDAAQAAGKVPLDVRATGIDLMSLSGHKCYGPKGVGALYLSRRRPRVRVAPQMMGGGHENGLRSGTLNVAGVVGLGAAARIAGEELAGEGERLRALAARLLARLEARIDGVALNGAAAPRLPGNLNLSIAGVEAETLMLRLRHVALASASACSNIGAKGSHVLRAMGLPEERVRGALRIGVGRFSTEAEIDAVSEDLAAAVAALRAADPRAHSA